MLYANQDINNYQPAPNYIDAYDYAGGSSGYNRATPGVESGASGIAGGVLSNIPVVSSFYKIGEGAYKGLKSTNSETGDFFANWFAPHHQILSTYDEGRKLKKRDKNLDLTTDQNGFVRVGGNKAVADKLQKDHNNNTIQGILDLMGGLVGSSIGSVMNGKQKRAEEQAKVDYNDKLRQWYANETGREMNPYQVQNPVKYDASITQGLISGATGLFNAYSKGNKNQPQADTQANMPVGESPQGFNSNGYDYTGMNAASPIATNPTGSNYNWNAGNYGFDNNVQQGFKYGGMAMVKGGKGKDDIALVDTNTGDDTGVRVTKGEMLVINKKNISALEEAIKNEDKDTIFDIIKSQFNKKPKITKGNKGFADGGLDNVQTQKPVQYVPDTLTDDEKAKLLEDTTVDYIVVDNNGNELGALLPAMDGAFSAKRKSPEEAVYGKTGDTQPLTDNEAIAKSVYESNEHPSFLNKIKGMNLENIAGNAYDGFRYATGINNSRRPLPEWQIPYDFTEYGQRLKNESTRGLDPVELAALNQKADENLAYGKEQVYNLSNGNAGLALANINNLGANRSDDALKIAALDKAQERDNLARYGGYLNTATAFDRTQFLDRLTQDERTKSAAAQLTQDAYHNMNNRFDYNRTYGQGSEYDMYQNALLQQKLQDVQGRQNYMNSLK